MLVLDTYKAKKNFKFRGFAPSPQLEKTTESFYKLIESRSPSDSKKQAVLTKRAGFYEARLTVSSASSCSFEIISRKKDQINSINSLQKKFLDKILLWSQSKKPESYRFQK